MKRTEPATAILFLCGLLGGLALSVGAFLGGEGHFESALRGLFRDPSMLGSFLANVEGAINQDLDRSHAFIELYGSVQRITGRQVVVDMANPAYTIAKLKDGTLAFQNLTAQPMDQTAHAQALADLQAFVGKTYHTPFVYVQAPQKIEAEQLPNGMENYGNEDADQLLSLLAESGVDTLDLRPTLRAAAQKPETPPLFFRTDHHWTPEAAFLSYQTLAPLLEERYGLHADRQTLAPEHYEITTYEDWFLGSQGKRVGTFYAGVDSINLWKPTFETSFTYSSPTYFTDRHGTFDQALLFPERLNAKDYYNGNPYTLYSGGDYSLARMYNHLNPDGKRVLLIRDSFSCALAPFLAFSCSELMTMDMRYLNDDFAGYLNWLRPDLVVVMYSASTTHLDEMFPFSDYLKP